jgi:SAM-dependent methyltransferase
MTDYAMLILPAANKVYARASFALMQNELLLFNAAVLGGRLRDIGQASLRGVPYLTFSADGLTDRDIGFLSNMSSLYALFESRGEWLKPVSLQRLDRFDDDLLTIQKYAGKTNELFTKLLLNITILSTKFASEMIERRLSVFDPLCGRGTTLNQALMFGFDAAGTEIDAKDFDAYRVFLETWLKQKRIKHRAEMHGRKDRKLGVTLAATKELYLRGDTITVSVVNTDTTRGLEFFRRASFDVVVADAPYGVQHGSRTDRKTLSRRPADLLASALPVWKELLRPGGAVGIAWNARVTPRAAASKIMANAGFEVLESGAYLGFEHRVDQTIVRDILVARRA